jgi:hypothetical protein
MIFITYESVRFAEKLWLKVLFADLLWEKNTVPAEKKQVEKYGLKDKRTGSCVDMTN